MLTGGSVGICGASAALAIASVLPRQPQARARHRDDRRRGHGAVDRGDGVVPARRGRASALDERTAGIFLGATIHDVAQVVGAGYSVSTSAGDTATIVKLFRVAMLLPVVLVISFACSERGVARHGDEARAAAAAAVPGRLRGAGCAEFGGLGCRAPRPLVMQEASRWCLVTAIAALGTKTSLGELARVGWRPVAIIVGETVFVGAVRARRADPAALTRVRPRVAAQPSGERRTSSSARGQGP